MILLPSLLVLQTNSRAEQNAELDDAVNGNYHRNSRHNNTGTAGSRRKHHKRQRKSSTTSQNPLRLRRILDSTPPRYNDYFHANPIAPFWERQQREEQQKESPGTKMVASMRRKSQLFAFFVTLASFVAVDTYMLLPAGTLAYAVALTMAWENWDIEAEENRQYLQQIRKQKARMRSLDRAIERARFEYHILKNKPHVDVVALRRRPNERHPHFGSSNNDDDESWIVYADDKKVDRINNS